MFLVTSPQRYDVIVTDNLFGDILTDLAAAVTGGIGLAASGNINPERAVPVDVRAGPRLGPGHRRARAWPTRSRRSSRSRCMLDHLGHPEAARPGRDAAVAAELPARVPGLALRTDEVGDRLASPRAA